MIISQVQDTDNTFPTFPWWGAIYSLFIIVIVFVVVASDTIQTYHVAVTGYLSGGMVLTTSSVNSLVYSKSGSREAAAAGFILLSMIIVRSLSRLFEGFSTDRYIDCLDLLFWIHTILNSPSFP